MIDDSAAAVGARLALVAVLIACAAAFETPAARPAALARVRVAVLGAFAAVGLAGFLSGPMGPFAAARRPHWPHEDAVCTERAPAVLACAADHDMRRRW